MVVNNNVDKVQLQTEINNYLQAGGYYFIYVNGMYTDSINLNIPNGSYVEYVYDQSVLSVYKFNISNLRTFQSILDDKLKYLLYRTKDKNEIQYWDDNELYISNNDTPINYGLYYYLHKDYAMRNVTDKDYSLYTTYVNNQVQALKNLLPNSTSEIDITMFVRRSGIDRSLVYSSLKLHELYKLPDSVQYDVMSNTNYTVTDFRVENLENSDYFKIAEADNLSEITPQLAYNALGYNAMSYYFANNIIDTGTTQGSKVVQVPTLYQGQSTAYEYDNSGKLIGIHTTTGVVYTTQDTTRYVEFIFGTEQYNQGSYYANTDAITLQHPEYRLYRCTYISGKRGTDWEDITDSYTPINNTITLNESPNVYVKIMYLNTIHSQTVLADLNNGLFYFPITVNETRPEGSGNFPAEIAYRNVSIFLNGYRLVQGLDYFLDYPNLCITNKSYIDYTAPQQSIHIRMNGPILDYTKINSTDITGFVNNGVLDRNNYYDIRDDRLFAIYIDGKLVPRSSVKWAEEDNTVRVSDSLNGLPYIVYEPYTPLKTLTGIDTEQYYIDNVNKNTRISQLYNIVFPEPTINEFNAIPKTHYIYSPTVSKIINDIIENNISPTLYTNPYTAQDIINLIDTNYSEIYKLDPIKYNLPDSLVTIHPHFGNSVISLGIFQYRFIMNVINVVTSNNPSKINISGYLALSV
jgi:YD repeat-containing protein